MCRELVAAAKLEFERRAPNLIFYSISFINTDAYCQSCNKQLVTPFGMLYNSQIYFCYVVSSTSPLASYCANIITRILMIFQHPQTFSFHARKLTSSDKPITPPSSPNINTENLASPKPSAEQKSSV